MSRQTKVKERLNTCNSKPTLIMRIRDKIHVRRNSFRSIKCVCLYSSFITLYHYIIWQNATFLHTYKHPDTLLNYNLQKIQVTQSMKKNYTFTTCSRLSNQLFRYVYVRTREIPMHTSFEITTTLQLFA